MLSTELGPAGGYLAGQEQYDDPGPVGPRIVVLYADPDTQANLTAWADAMGFDVGGSNPHEGHAFHITLLATVNDVATPLTDHLVEPVTVYPDRLEVIGEDTPALLVSEPDGWLFDMRRYFVGAYNAEPTFDFKPHVSLSYSWRGEPALADLEPPDFPMRFDRLVVDVFDGAKGAAPPEAKFIGLLFALGAVGLAATAVIAAAEGGFWLTRELASRIIDWFRGEEAVLLDAIAEKERELSAAEAAEAAAGTRTDALRDELDALNDRLDEVRGAIDQVEAEPRADDGKADLAALIRALEGKAENGEDDDDAYETDRGYWLARLDRMGQRLQASEERIDYLLDQLQDEPGPDDIYQMQREVEAQVDTVNGILGEAAGIAAVAHPSDGEVLAEVAAVQRRGEACLLDFLEAALEFERYLGSGTAGTAPTAWAGNGVW